MTRWLFRLALLAAVTMLAAVPFMAISAEPCSPTPASALVSFELVRSTEDVQRILGLPGDACRAALAPQLDHANIVDTFAYIPAYMIFYVLVALALGAQGRRLAIFTAALAIACGIADVLENVGMLTLSAAPDAPTPWLAVLIPATNFKWIGLAAVTTLCGFLLSRRGGLWWFALPACAVPLGSSLWAVFDPDAAAQHLLPAMTLASVILLLVAIWGAIRRDKTTVAPA